MFKEEIGNEFIVIQEGTSEGTQIKYRKDGFWYKRITEDMKDVQNIWYQNLWNLRH